MLDNVLTSFIETAPDSMERAKYSALRERSVGLGVMGFHSFLQSKNIPMESAMAKSWNLRIFKKIRREADAASYILAEERGACPDAAEKGMKARFSHKIAIAPTASISIICGGTTACVEPIPANVYTHKTLSGAFSVRNPYLQELLASKGLDTPEIWQSIVEQEGSVQHLDCLSEDEKVGLSAPPSRSTSAGSSNWRPTARPISARASRSTCSCPPTSTSGICTCCTGRRGSAASRASITAAPNPSAAPVSPASWRRRTRAERRAAPSTDYEECLACQ